jgi:hypothetical protein
MDGSDKARKPLGGVNVFLHAHDEGAYGIDWNGRFALAGEDRIHPVNPVHPVVRFLRLSFDCAQGLELVETALCRGENN